ncbi:MAG: DUF5110 domain-containing protein [Spirochaetaceae bacterium]
MKKIIFGKPFNTEAIINTDKIIETKEIVSYIKTDVKNGFTLTYPMDPKDIVYGLGENVNGLNKRGGLYESFCTDDFDHTPDKKSLYAAHNLIIIDGQRNFGIYIDHPGMVSFDIGFTDKDNISIYAENPNLNLYLIEGDSTKIIVKKFREAIGLSFVPPKWAFGFQQSRWSYPDEKAITKIADEFLEKDIPCDSIYMDIDYMDNYKNFTVDNNKFPNFPEFVKTIKDKGFRLIPIIDAGCKIEEGYNIYDEGLELGHYCVDKVGKTFVGAVWPGRVHFPDFMNAKSRKWFGDKYKFLIDQGIEGFWNDMNEPAIFYSEEGIKKAYKKLEKVKGTNLDIYSFFDIKDTFSKISNNIDDYKSFYHNVDGELINHYDLHNLYGYNMTRAASDSMSDLYPNKRFLLFSRASSVGMHRYGGIWTGDNKSWWEHLELNIKMLPSINMVGFLYSGADVGGFGCNANAELTIRWTQFGIFTPLLRNHAALGTRNQEPFSFDSETTDILRDTIKLRYALIPYIYSEYMKSVIQSESYIKPLSFEYIDNISRRIEDQVLIGDSIMLTPIYKANNLGRNVYLPEDMLLTKASNYKKMDFEVIQKGHSYINVDLHQVPLFIRKNKILVIGNHAKNVESINNKEIEIVAFVESKASYTLYDDDGKTDNYKDGTYSEVVFTITKGDTQEFEVLVGVKGFTEIRVINYNIISPSGYKQIGTLTI